MQLFSVRDLLLSSHFAGSPLWSGRNVSSWSRRPSAFHAVDRCGCLSFLLCLLLFLSGRIRFLARALGFERLASLFSCLERPPNEARPRVIDWCHGIGTGSAPTCFPMETTKDRLTRMLLRFPVASTCSLDAHFSKCNLDNLHRFPKSGDNYVVGTG